MSETRRRLDDCRIHGETTHLVILEADITLGIHYWLQNEECIGDPMTRLLFTHRECLKCKETK